MEVLYNMKKAIKKAKLGTTLVLGDGIYYVDKTQKINGNISKSVIGKFNNVTK